MSAYTAKPTRVPRQAAINFEALVLIENNTAPTDAIARVINHEWPSDSRNTARYTHRISEAQSSMREARLPI